MDLPHSLLTRLCSKWCNSSCLLHAVENRRSGEVYLEGELERGIVPAQSVWTHGGGGGEDGCLLLLQKMNLELLQRCVFPPAAPATECQLQCPADEHAPTMKHLQEAAGVRAHHTRCPPLRLFHPAFRFSLTGEQLPQYVLSSRV